MVGMAQTKGDLCKEVRCHHILINLFLGGGWRHSHGAPCPQWIGSYLPVRACHTWFVLAGHLTHSMLPLIHTLVTLGGMKFLVYLNGLR